MAAIHIHNEYLYFTEYIDLLADRMQSSIVKMIGEPVDESIHALQSSRFLVANSTSSSGIEEGLQTLAMNSSISNTTLNNTTNITITATDEVPSEIICWKECTVLYPLLTDNKESDTTAVNMDMDMDMDMNMNIGDNSTICWDECIDVIIPESKPKKGHDRCYNECLTLDPTMDKNTTINSTDIFTDPIVVHTNTTNSTNITITKERKISSVLFNSTSNVTGSIVTGIYLNSAKQVSEKTIQQAIETNAFDVVCWKECPVIIPTMAPTMAPTLKPWKGLLKEAQNTTSEMDEEEWNPNNLSDGEILRQTLNLYGTFFILCMTIFCVARKMYPRPFNLRSGWVDEDIIKSNPRAKRPEDLGWFTWFYKIWLVSDTELSDECGMDALCLSRVLEWGVRITAFGSLVGCLFLMPIYATAGGVHAGEQGVERLNTSNVPDGADGRFVATVLSAYLIFGFVMYTTIDEFEWFYKFRYEFLSRPLPRNYVVYVRNLERDYRTKNALVEYFSHFEDPSARHKGEEQASLLLHDNNKNDSDNATKAWVALKIPKLRKLVDKRTSVLSKLEHQINIQEVCTRFPKTRCEKSGAVLTVVDALFNELKDLNAEIKIAIERIEMRARLDDPHEYDAEDYQNPYEVEGSDNGDYTGGHEDENSMRNLFFDTIPITPSMDNTDVTKNSNSIYISEKETRKSWDEEEVASKGPRRYLDSGEPLRMENPNEDVSNSDLSNSEGMTITSDLEGNSDGSSKALRRFRGMARVSMALVGNKVGQVGKVAGTAANVVGKQVEKVAGTAADAVGTAAHVVVGQATNVATNVVGGLIGPRDDDGAPMTAGFVAFSTLKACQAAKQMSHSSEVFGMEVFEAPGFDDVFWHNVGKTHKELQMGMLLSFCLTAGLCLSWTVVMTAIATLSSVQGLVAIVPIIGVWLEKAPWLEMLLAQISPLMIILADEVLKVILEILSKLEGPVSGMVVQASLFTKISVFKIVQTFFVNAVSGSLVSQLSAISVIAKDPSTVVTLVSFTILCCL